jgi:hypothetical protein
MEFTKYFLQIRDDGAWIHQDAWLLSQIVFGVYSNTT